MPDLPPPPNALAPTAERVLRAATSFSLGASKDIPLTLVKANRTEKAYARYQIYIKTEVQAVAVETPSVTALQADCIWKLTATLQRQLCFESMTGAFACAEIAVRDLMAGEDGRRTGPEAETVAACGLAEPTLAEAGRRLADDAQRTQQVWFDDDLKRSLVPLLTRTGVTVKLTP